MTPDIAPAVPNPAAIAAAEGPSLKEVLSGAGLALHKLAGMPPLIERIGVLLSEELKGLGRTPVKCTAGNIDTLQARNAFDFGGSSIVALFAIADWDAPLAIHIERIAVTAAIDWLFGGDGTEPLIDAADEPGAFELRVASDLATRCARAVQTALKPFTEIEPILERVTASAEDAKISAKPASFLVAALACEIFDKTHVLQIIAPRSALLPFRNQLDVSGTETPSEDPHWVRDLRTKVAGTHVEVRAIAGGPTMTLDEIARMRPGQIIPLDNLGTGDITLEASARQMFSSTLGQSHGRLCVRVDGPLTEAPPGLTETVIGEAMRSWDTLG